MKNISGNLDEKEKTTFKQLVVFINSSETQGRKKI